uniref:Transposase n=1 Tax=Ditylenchus dipsaci TaxID=166011 RepID=A0A915DCQ4_9BILA
MSSSKKASTNTATPVPPKKKKSNDATLLSGEDMEFVERSKRHRHPIWKWFQPFVCQDTPEGEDGSEQVSQLGKVSSRRILHRAVVRAVDFYQYLSSPLNDSFPQFDELRFSCPQKPLWIIKSSPWMAEEMREQIKVKLSNLEWKASVSLDIWSDSTMKTYMGATISFIDTQDLTLRTLVLGVIRLVSSSTGDYIRQMTSDLLKKYGLSLNSIKRVVTDNADASTDDEEDEFYADDMPRFIEFPALAIPNSQRISCAAHLFQNVLENGMKSTLMKHPGFKAIQKMASTLESLLYAHVCWKMRLALV